MASSAPITATKLIPLMKNPQPGPRVARTIPPMAGPNARAALNCAEFSVTAFSSTSRGTSSDTKACHEPIIRPANAPDRAANATIAPGDRTPALHIAHRIIATAAWADCITISTFRRSRRSASVPPMGPNRAAVISRLNPAKPTHVSLSVSLKMT